MPHAGHAEGDDRIQHAEPSSHSMSERDWQLLATFTMELSRAPLRQALHNLAERLVPAECLSLVVLGLGPAGWPVPVVERYSGRDEVERGLVIQWAGHVLRRGLHATEPIRLADDEAPLFAFATPLRHAGAPVGVLALVASDPDHCRLVAPWFMDELASMLAERLALEVGTTGSPIAAPDAAFAPTWMDGGEAERPTSPPEASHPEASHPEASHPEASLIEASSPDVATRPEQDQFLAAMSHELRTPLNAILGLTESLLEGVYGTVSQEQETALQDIEASGRLLLALINDVLDLSKIRAGMMSVDLGPLDLAQVARAVGSLLAPQARQANVTLVLDGDPMLQAVQSDGRLLLQIAVNLLANALKFTPSGGTVILRWGANPDGDGALLSVTDSGPGIAAADQERIFTPFVQIASGLGRQHGGSGLGLALVRRMAPLIGARISLTSRLGEGSTFRMHVPFAPAE